MGWHPLADNQRLFASDTAADAMRDALERISEAYLSRFGRRPALKEILSALSSVLRSCPEDLVLDENSLDGLDHLARTTEPARLPVFPDDFKASWKETPPPKGEFEVERRVGGEVVLRARLKVDKEVLYAEYDRVEPTLTEDDAECLIICCICKELTGDHYATKASVLSFSDAKAPSLVHEIRYPVDA